LARRGTILLCLLLGCGPATATSVIDDADGALVRARAANAERYEATLADLRAAGVDIVTLGQYLRPTVNHLAVQRFVRPEEFDRYRELALARGFLECVSGPLVRSSYRAEQALNRNNAGLDNRRLAT